MTDAKKADLAGPGIGDYDELEKILPNDYSSILSPRETQIALYAVKDYIEENLCRELNLIRVTVPNLYADFEKSTSR
jgi:aspartate--ammonia ligase